MFSVDQLIIDLRACVHEASPLPAVREVLERACSAPAELATALPPERSEVDVLYAAPDLTILKVVWGPGMSFQPHNHLMWAAIGIYTGGEDNTFYRRSEHGLTESGGRSLRPMDVCLLGDDTIHAVTNPTRQHAGAIHVYGGDLIGNPERSEWDPATFAEQPYDVAAMHATFAAANSSAA